MAHYTHAEIVQLVARSKDLDAKAKAAKEAADSAIDSAIARSPSV